VYGVDLGSSTIKHSRRVYPVELGYVVYYGENSDGKICYVEHKRNRTAGSP
jgi:hypothetical protein